MSDRPDLTATGNESAPTAGEGSAAAGSVLLRRDPMSLAETSYRALFLSIDDPILVADGQSHYLDANPAATALLGYTREELRQLRVADVVAAGMDWTQEQFQRFLRDGHWRGELDLRTKAGTLVTVEAHASVVNLPHERVNVSILRDTSARWNAEREREEVLRGERAARRQAEEAIRFRDEVITTIAHDLGNPLTAIKASAQLLRRQLAEAPSSVPPPAAISLDRIELWVGQMQGALEELADLAYLQVGVQPQLSLHPTDLVAVVRRLVDQQRASTETHTFEVRADVPELVGSWDQGRLERVVTNLLLNAIKYSPSGGSIIVEIRHDEVEGQPGAVLVVRDTGIGIPVGELPHIFALRRRGSNVPSSIRGQGVGLTSARQTVELHGGTIAVESQEGVGSTFIVRLPLVVSRDPVRTSKKEEARTV